MARRTAIYMRVSTQDQSVESQRHELRRFIEARDDLVLIGEYEDVISGVTEKREQLDELMKAGRQRRIDAVVFFDFTRLTRLTRMCHWAALDHMAASVQLCETPSLVNAPV